MRIEYIFIRKSNEPEKVTDKIHTRHPPFKPILKELFSDVSDNTFKIKLRSKEYTVSYNHAAYKSEETDQANSMHDLSISIDGQRKDRSAEILTAANQAILCSGIRERYSIILTYDGVSKYYCDRAYPNLNEFERCIRNLVFRIVTKAFGADWLDKTTTEEKKNGLKARIQTRPKTLRNERLIEAALYEMDIKELEDYLFLPKRDISCEQVIDFDLSLENLKKMTKEQIEAKINIARPRSLWERQFSNKVSVEGLQEALQQIRAYRNQVAHAKPFSYNDFTECRSILQEINPQIEQAINDISIKKYDLPETIRTIAGFGEAWTATISKALEFNKGISAAVSELGSSLREAYKALKIMPQPAEMEALRQMAALRPTLSMMQSPAMLQLQEQLRSIRESVSIPAPQITKLQEQLQSMQATLQTPGIQMANQVSQMIQNALPQFEAIQQAYRMNDLASAAERSALFSNRLGQEIEAGIANGEIEEPEHDGKASPEKINEADNQDNSPEKC
jgi:hypothetical protein